MTECFGSAAPICVCVCALAVLGVMKIRLVGATKGHALLKKKADALTMKFRCADSWALKRVHAPPDVVIMFTL